MLDWMIDHGPSGGVAYILGVITTFALGVLGHKRRMYEMLNEESSNLLRQMNDELRTLRDRDSRRAEEMDALRRQHKQDMSDLARQLRSECAAELAAIREAISAGH